MSYALNAIKKEGNLEGIHGGGEEAHWQRRVAEAAA
jgi:hypothetical protein